MLYSEFVQGTGCKENDHNYEVYKNLEAMYMNTDLTKEQIYEYGRKLVDNSKSAEQIAFEEDIERQIEEAKSDVKWYTEKAAFHAEVMEDKKQASYYRARAKEARATVRQLRWVLA